MAAKMSVQDSPPSVMDYAPMAPDEEALVAGDSALLQQHACASEHAEQMKASQATQGC